MAFLLALFFHVKFHVKHFGMVVFSGVYFENCSSIPIKHE